MSASERDDADACPFCNTPGLLRLNPNHVLECLQRHHDEVVSRDHDDAARAGMVRVETEGDLLIDSRSSRPFVMEIPLGDVTREYGDGLNQEVTRRLSCLNASDPRLFTYNFTVGAGRKDLLRNGTGLYAGAGIYVRLSWKDEAGHRCLDAGAVGGATDVAPAQEMVDATPSAKILRNDKQYYDRQFDKISYVLSEFVDNSLQFVLLAHFERIEQAKRSGDVERIRAAEARRPWIRLTIVIAEDGEMAFCIEDNGTGIRHERLASAMRQKDPDMLLKKTKLKDEHARPLFLDALLSEYGIGLKNAGFFLADILKVVSKLSRPTASDGSQPAATNDVYECVVDYNEQEQAADAVRFHYPKQPRQAGQSINKNSVLERVSKIEDRMKVSWFKDRLVQETTSKDDGGLGWFDASETGTAIMFYQLRDQHIGKETKQLTKELLRDAHQIASDLQNIYYWYGCGKPDDSLIDIGSSSSEAGSSSVAMALPPRRELSGGTRQAEAARAAASAALPPKSFRGGMGGRGKQQKTPPQDSAAQKSSRQPLVNIEVQLVTPNPADSIGPISLETFSHKDYLPPFERELDNIVRQHGSGSGPPLAKVFYAQYREEVQDKSAKNLYIKWNVEMMVCYCPFKGGEETIEKINKCRPKGQSFEGFGDGPTYWHGKLVPGTHVGKVPWFGFDSETITKAVFDLTSSGAAGRGVSAGIARRNDELRQSAHRVIIRWFFNSRTLVSDDKYELESFDPKHLLPQDARPASDRAAPTSADAVEVMKKTDLNVSEPKSRLVISDCKFETNLPPDVHIGTSSLEDEGGQELKPGKQPKGTLRHKGDEKTLADGLRKVYDFVLRASKHDEVAMVEVVGERDAKSIQSVDFLGAKYMKGSIVHFMKCKEVEQRELFVGRIISFRLQVDPDKEYDPLLRAKTPDALRQYKLQDLSRSSVLSKDQSVEVELRWLPEERDEHGEWVLRRLEDVSWVPLEHVQRPDLRSARVEVVGRDDTFGDKFDQVQVLRWSAKPAAMDLAEKPAREIDAPPVHAVRAMDCEDADIIYSAETNMHQALRHYLESSTGRRADASKHHYHVLRTEPPEFGAAQNADCTETVKVKPCMSWEAVWHEVWRKGAFTFRALPTCSLTLRQLAADAAEHPAVTATKSYLKSSVPKTDLYVKYHRYDQPQDLCVSLDSSPHPQQVDAGADMASCYVQIHDQGERPIMAMPFVMGSGGSLTMMRKLKLRRVQFVRKAQADHTAEEEGPEQPSSSQPSRGASARHSSRGGAASSAKGKNPYTERDLTDEGHPGWKERTTTGREGRKDKTWHGPAGEVIKSRIKFDAYMHEGGPASQDSAQEGDEEEDWEGDDDDDVEDDHDNDDDGWVPVLGDGGGNCYKKNNTWEFAKLGARHMATKEYGKGASSTFRVPMGFQPSSGEQNGGTDYGLYRFNNTCLEYKVEMVAVLDQDSDTCHTWQPVSSWCAIVTVKARDADAQDAEDTAGVKLVSDKLHADKQTPYHLGEVLPVPLCLINTDGQDANKNRGNRGNLIPWKNEPLMEPRIDFRLANGEGHSAGLRLCSPTPEQFSTRMHSQSVELLEPVSPGQPQRVPVMHGCMQVKDLRLKPTRTANFHPEVPCTCELTFSFGPANNRKEIEIGSLAVLPGPPHKLVREGPTSLLELQAVRGQPGMYHLPALYIAVKDQFDLPTHSGAPDLAMKVTCAAASGQPMALELFVTGSNPRSFKNGPCRAEFSEGELRIKTTSHVPRGGVEVELTFEVPLPDRDCPTHAVKVRLLPPREPHYFELLYDGNVIQPTAPAGVSPAGTSASSRNSRRPAPRELQQDAAAVAIPTFVIEARPNAAVPNLVLRVRTALGDDLDGDAKYTLGTEQLTSGEELPEMTNGSFGAEVVRDYTARQFEKRVDVYARASDACICVISLRPIVVLENLTWRLGPLDQAALAAGTRAPLTVGKAWTDKLELRVVDESGSIFAVPGGVPNDVKRRLTTPSLTFQSTVQARSAQIVAQGSGPRPAERVVGTAGDYVVVVSSSGEVGSADVRPIDSAQLPVTLSAGDVNRMVVTTQMPLIRDRCKLPAGAIAIQLLDEGGNRVQNEKAHRYEVRASSEHLVGQAVEADVSDEADHHFALEATSVFRRFRSRGEPGAHPAAYPPLPQLSLDFQLLQEDSQGEQGAAGQRRQRRHCVLQEKFVIGTGWERSSRIRHLEMLEEPTLSPGSSFPPLDFWLVTDDGSVLEGFSAHTAQVKLTPLVPPAQGVECPRIHFELTDAGCIRVRAINDQQIFKTVGTYTFTLTHTEARAEWADLLSDEERMVGVTMRIKVALGDEPPPSTRFVLDPEPPGPLYQTDDRQRALHDQLYSMNAAGSPPMPVAFNTSLRRVDAFRNRIAGSFEVWLYLRERPPGSKLIQSRAFQSTADASRSSRSSTRGQDSLQIPARFITDMFTAANQLEVNKEYAISLKDCDHPDDELFTFTFTTNARRDELLGLLQRYQSDFEDTHSALDQARRMVDNLKGELRQQFDASAELPQSADEADAKVQALTEQLKQLEAQLDAARPQYPGAQRDTMSRLVSDGAVPHDFVGVVGELASVVVVDNPNASRQAACLSQMLHRKMGFLVVKSTPSMARVQAERPTFNFDELPWADAQQQLPHLVAEEGGLQQPGRRERRLLKKHESLITLDNPQGWAPGALRVLTASTASTDQQAQMRAVEQKLASFTAALRNPLDVLQFHPPPHLPNCTEGLRRLFTMLISGRLFITHEALARDYAQVVKRHPPLICLDTGRVYSQGQAAGDDQMPAPINWGSPPPSYFLSPELLEGLQQKWQLEGQYRTMNMLPTAMRDLHNKDEEHRGFADQREGNAELLRELQEIEGAGTALPSKQSEVDELVQFFADGPAGRGGRGRGGRGSRGSRGGRVSRGGGSHGAASSSSNGAGSSSGRRRPRGEGQSSEPSQPAQRRRGA